MLGLDVRRSGARVSIRPKRSKAEMAGVFLSQEACFVAGGLREWYDPLLLGPSTIGEYASSAECAGKLEQLLSTLEPDDYVTYLLAYYREGLRRFGRRWRYADIATVLLAVAEIAKPETYLEIGVRRGRSMAVVASARPECRIVGFDLWVQDYAGMANPGPEFVRGQLNRIGYRGELDLISGDSHREVPDFLARNPAMQFDLITVDGDHSRRGAVRDIRDVLPRLRVGGVLVFDDIVHPAVPHLQEVWKNEVASSKRFACWDFRELGYGVALAIRRS